MADLKDRIRGQFEKSIIRYREILSRIEWVPRGILLSEGFAFCAVADLFEINTIIESGIFNGRSTQIWAEYFPKDITILAIDQSLKGATIERLREYKNVWLIQDDSRKALKDQISLLSNKKIAIFIDGPKGYRAVDLARACLESENVIFVGVHDVPKSEKARQIMEKWDVSLFFTDEDWFIEAYKWLDRNESNWNLGKERKWIPYKIIYDYGKSTLELGSYGPTIGFAFNRGIIENGKT